MFGTRNTFVCACQCCRKHLCTPAQAGGCLPGMPLAMLGSAKESGHHSGAPARGCQSDRWGQKIQGSIFSLSGRTGVSWGPARGSRSQSQNGQAGRTTVSHRSKLPGGISGISHSLSGQSVGAPSLFKWNFLGTSSRPFLLSCCSASTKQSLDPSSRHASLDVYTHQ